MGKTAKFGIGVLITADDKASRVIGGVAAKAKAISGGIGKMFAGVARAGMWAGGIAAVGIGIAAKMTKDMVGQTNEIAKFSKQTGFGAEALQEWTFAANQAGVGAEDLNKAIVYVSRGFGELKANTGALYSFLQRRGDFAFISQLKKVQDPAKAMDLILAKMEKIKDPTSRSALAMAAFGRSGAKMARLTAQGTEATDKLRQRARDLGLVIKAESLPGIEDLSDRMDEVKFSIQGVARDVLISLVPGLNKATGGMVDWIAANRKMIVGRAVEFLHDLWRGLVRVGDWLKENWPTIKKVVVDGFNLATDAIKFLVDNLDLIKIAIVGIGTAWTAGKVIEGFGTLSSLAKSISKGLAAGAGSTSAIIVAAGALGAAVSVWLDAYDKWSKFKDWQDEQNAANKETAKNLGKRVGTFNESQAALQSQVTDVSSPLASILSGRMMSTPSGSVTLDVRFLDAPMPISVSQTTEGQSLRTNIQTARRLIGR